MREHKIQHLPVHCCTPAQWLFSGHGMKRTSLSPSQTRVRIVQLSCMSSTWIYITSESWLCYLHKVRHWYALPLQKAVLNILKFTHKPSSGLSSQKKKKEKKKKAVPFNNTTEVNVILTKGGCNLYHSYVENQQWPVINPQTSLSWFLTQKPLNLIENV